MQNQFTAKPAPLSMSPAFTPRVAIDRELSTPTGRGSYLSVAAKADAFGDMISWRYAERTNPLGIFATSPTSGREYKISYSVLVGQHVCNCAAGSAGRHCYHLEVFGREWLAKRPDVFLPRTVVAPLSRPVWDAATFAANLANDFGN